MDLTFSMMSSAVAVHSKGSQVLFQVSVNESMALVSTLVELNVPRRITFRVRIPFQISISFSHDALVGVKWNTNRPFCLSSHFAVSADRCGEALSSTTWIFSSE